MATQAPAPPRTDQPRSGSGLAAMLRIRLRSDRVRITVWTLSTIVLFWSVVASIKSLYPTPKLQAGYAQALEGNQAFVAINGIPYGADTLGGIVADEFAFIAPVLLPVLVTSLIARATRGAEESGLVELVRSRGVSRTAPLAAASIVVAGVLVVIGVAAGAILAAYGVPTGPSFLYGASLTGLGLVWLGISGLAAQLVRHTRGVWTLSLGLLLAAYLVRAYGDVEDIWVKWASPLVWFQETRAFADDARWWPLVIPLVAVAVLVGVAVTVLSRRDLGSGVLASRPGPESAAAALTSPWGLAARTSLSLVASWSAVSVLIGLVFAGLTKEAASALDSNAQVAEVLGGGGGVSPEDGYLSFTLVIVALVAGAAVVQGVARVAEQETDGIAEVVLARPVGRFSWALAWVTASLVTGAATLVVGAFATGAGAALSLDDGERVGSLTAAGAGYVPALVLLAGLCLAVLGLVPRLQSVCWVVVAWAAVVATLGDTLELADWLRTLSPYDALGMLPVDDVDTTAVVVLLALGVALGLLGLAGLRRRDLRV
ncbi:UNVERIFIED_CONTAM: hypothetical protein LK11_13735 [Mumia flava]